MRSGEDIHSLADEFVLGLLDDRESAELEKRIEHDLLWRAAVAASRDRFLPLDMAGEPAAVDPGLWSRIEPSLAGQRQADPAARKVRADNDNRTRLWRGAALSGFAASLLLTIGLGFSLMRTMEPVVLAVLLDDSGRVRAVVEDFGNENASVRLLDRLDVPDGKTIQVWTLPSRDMGPVSLGLLDDAKSARLHGPRLPNPRNEQLYELTLEQAGGSPTGRPTGPILAKGFARAPL